MVEYNFTKSFSLSLFQRETMTFSDKIIILNLTIVPLS
jgi:hypothetical protein